MAHITEPRVQETTTTTGTGAVALAGAVVAHKAFSAVCANGDTVWYDIAAVDTNGAETGEWEEGLGTYGSGANELTRTTVFYSSNSNSPVSFAAGTKTVRIIAYAPQIRAVPRGGTSGQVLSKVDGTDYNLQWSTPSGGASVITVTPSADQSDYSPTGWSGATTVRFNHSAAIVISGFAAGSAGERKTLINVTAELPLVICDEAVTSSTAANRVIVSGGLVRGHLLLKGGASAVIEYDGTSSRWRLVSVRDPSQDWAQRSVRPISNSSTVNAFGVAIGSETGGSAAALGTTQYIDEFPRISYATSGVAGQSRGHFTNTTFCTRGSAAGRGGFAVRTRFGGGGNAANAGSVFVGLRATASGIGDVDASTLVNCFGVGTDAGQGTYRRLVNDGSGTATAVDLGSNFPWSSAAAFDLMLMSAANGSGLAGFIQRTDDLSVPPLVWFDTSDLPSTSTALSWHCHVGNRAVNVSYSITFEAADFYTPN